MGKAPDPAKPNLPKQEVGPVINASQQAPAMPFGGRIGMDENRANMAANLLSNTGQPKPMQNNPGYSPYAY
jgi:hypothetical protein